MTKPFIVGAVLVTAIGTGLGFGVEAIAEAHSSQPIVASSQR